MLRSLILLLIISGFVSCSEKNVSAPEAPADLIARDKMILILTDIHILEAGIEEHNNKSAMTNTVAGPLPYFDVYKKHGVTEDQYKRSFNYYAADLTGMAEMYDKVVSELNRRQAEAVRKSSNP